MEKLTPIPFETAKSLCRLGTGSTCCAYLAADSNGFCCLKHTPHEFTIVQRLTKGTMNAKGDHCDGWLTRENKS